MNAENYVNVMLTVLTIHSVSKLQISSYCLPQSHSSSHCILNDEVMKNTQFTSLHPGKHLLWFPVFAVHYVYLCNLILQAGVK